MVVINNRKFSKNQEVAKEIERYRWIESMKCGYDIGFVRATEQWFQLHAAAWFKYHMPDYQYKKLKFSFRRASYLRPIRY